MAVRRASLAELEAEARQLAAEVREHFGTLDPERLNRKPSAERWSIAECLEHLRITDGGYLEFAERLQRGERIAGALGRVTGFGRLFANLLLGSLTPTAVRRYKAPAPWQPTKGTSTGDAVARFLADQNRLLEAIRAARHLDSEHLMVHSPAARWMCYTWADALRIVIAHQRRHVNQALAVLEQVASRPA
jgi:uncharacterized damage-inducible protein DinB